MKKVIAFVAAALLSSVVVADDGQAVYNKACAMCHAAGVANAPKAHDADAWAPRLAAGIDAAVASAIAGKGAMPPKGLCMTCTDDELKAAIEFMAK